MAIFQFSAGQRQCIELLSQLLAEAQEGRISGMAAIIPRSGRVDVHMVGASTAQDLYFGAGILQDRVLAVAAPRHGGPIKAIIE